MKIKKFLAAALLAVTTGSTLLAHANSDREEAIRKMVSRSAVDRRRRAKENPQNKFLWVYVNNKIRSVGSEEAISWPELSAELNELGQRTPTGLEFNPARANAMYKKLKLIYE